MLKPVRKMLPIMVLLAFIVMFAGSCQSEAPANANNSTINSSANNPVPVTSATATPMPPVTITATPPAPTVTPADRQDSVVQPGVKMGSVALAMERAKVLELLGRPLVTYTVGEVMVDNWGADRTDNFLQVYYRAGKVAQIAAASPAFATKEGLSTKSTPAQVRQVYKNLSQAVRHNAGEGEAEAGDTLYLDERKAGVTFVFLKDEGYLLIVHEPGTEVIRTDNNGT